MIALFQTPKCERCELGGRELPRYWCTVPERYLVREGCYTAAAFKLREHSEAWCKWSNENRGSTLIVVQGEVVNKNPFSWKQVTEDAHIIKGAWHASVWVAIDADATAKITGMGTKMPILVLTKPLSRNR